MTFEAKSFAEVFADLRARAGSSPITDFEVGSVARTLYESFAYELALLHEKMRLVYLSAYVDTAEGQQLNNVVSLLGIRRGEPDYAVGMVTFTRDAGMGEVAIPLGTLVSTPETPGAPKKVYQTIEARAAAKGETAIDVKVQALVAGADQVTPAGSIAVMPRPLPGVKSVTNREAIRFSGRRRETDDELRERAKNALISAGKATAVSIENALLSLPGIKDAKVREPFHFAEGSVAFERSAGTNAVTIAKGTRVIAQVGGVEKPFATTERVVLADGQPSIVVVVRAGLEGRAGELTESSGVVWRIEGAGLETLTVRHIRPLVLQGLGTIEVVVDGPDLAEPSEKERVWNAIDRVRAAGVFVLLKSATPTMVDGVFRVELNPALKLSSEERAKYEEAVQAELDRLIKDLKMGEPLLFSKLTKAVLSVDGVENLDDFRLSAISEASARETPFLASDKRIEVDELERLHARYLCVSSEAVKPLPVAVQFKAAGLNEDALASVVAALRSCFGAASAGVPVRRTDIVAQLASVGVVGLEAASIRLVPRPWAPRPLYTGGSAQDVAVTFVEKPVLGDVFGYRSHLDVTGAVKLVLPAAMSDAEKQAVQAEVRRRIEAYLDDLDSESDVVLQELTNTAKAVEGVRGAEVDWRDFRAIIEDAEQPGRVTAKAIEVSRFEKPRAGHLCVTSKVELVRVTVTVALQAISTAGASPEQQQALRRELETAANNVIGSLLAGASPGKDVAYAGMRRALQGLVPGVQYVVTGLSLVGVSACDGRTQTADDVDARDIHIRSTELAVLSTHSVTVTVNPGGG